MPRRKSHGHCQSSVNSGRETFSEAQQAIPCLCYTMFGMSVRRCRENLGAVGQTTEIVPKRRSTSTQQPRMTSQATSCSALGLRWIASTTAAWREEREEEQNTQRKQPPHLYQQGGEEERMKETRENNTRKKPEVELTFAQNSRLFGA